MLTARGFDDTLAGEKIGRAVVFALAVLTTDVGDGVVK